MLWDLGTTGIAESGAASVVTLLAGFDTDHAATAAQTALLRQGFDVASSTIEPVSEAAWVDEERRGTLHLSTGTIDLEVGAAFGHGDHPTTALALALLGTTTTNGCNVLDFGTGTGVLAVAAAANGADSIVAVDNDPAALTVAAANLAANSGNATITLAATSPEPPKLGYDVIAANVLLDVHRRHGTQLAEALAPTGSMIVSGVLASQRDAVLAAYPTLVVADERTGIPDGATDVGDDPWIGLRLVSSGGRFLQ